jgi:hypothetical protein
MHGVMERIAAALADQVPPEPIAIHGSWRRAVRRTYREASLSGTGKGPYVEVEDLRWSGVAKCAVPLAALALLSRGPTLHWVKSAPAVPDLPIDLSLHAYREHRRDRATFLAGLGHVWLPGFAVSGGPDWTSSCALGEPQATAGRPHRVAAIDGLVFFAVFLPGALLKTGRNHLWRLRDPFAAELPDDLRTLLTRGRSGRLTD